MKGGREGRGGEGRGGEGRGGEGRGEEGRGGVGKGGEGMTAFEYNNDVTYYVITCKSPFDWVYTEQWYVIITSDVTWTE